MKPTTLLLVLLAGAGAPVAAAGVEVPRIRGDSFRRVFPPPPAGGDMFEALLVLLSGQGPVAAAHPGRLELNVRIHADPGVHPATVDGARVVARRLLASAGVDTAWQVCEPRTGCDPSTRSAGNVFVILSREALSGRQENCGRAAVGSRPAEGTVKISVPCVIAVASQLAGRRGGTIHPMLLVSRYDDLLGAVVAHEIGHVLGLRHGTALMRARLDPRDVVALRLGTLAFAPVDAARMRMSVAALGREPERATAPEGRPPGMRGRVRRGGTAAPDVVYLRMAADQF